MGLSNPKPLSYIRSKSSFVGRPGKRRRSPAVQIPRLFHFSPAFIFYPSHILGNVNPGIPVVRIYPCQIPVLTDEEPSVVTVFIHEIVGVKTWKTFGNIKHFSAIAVFIPWAILISRFTGYPQFPYIPVYFSCCPETNSFREPPVPFRVFDSSITQKVSTGRIRPVIFCQIFRCNI